MENINIYDLLSDEDSETIDRYRKNSDGFIRGTWLGFKVLLKLMYNLFIVLVLLGIFLKDYGLASIEYIGSVIQLGIVFSYVALIMISYLIIAIIVSYLVYSLRKDKLLQNKGYIAKYHKLRYDKIKEENK